MKRLGEEEGDKGVQVGPQEVFLTAWLAAKLELRDWRQVCWEGRKGRRTTQEGLGGLRGVNMKPFMDRTAPSKSTSQASAHCLSYDVSHVSHIVCFVEG